MDKLTAHTAFGAPLDRSFGTVRLREVDPGPMWSIAPYRGQTKAVDTALHTLGAGWPEPQRCVGATGAQCVWMSRGQALLIGAQPPEALTGLAALTDQSDGWCAVLLEGPSAQDVLARLVPVDLREGAFASGHCLRSLLNHLPLHVTRLGPASFRLLSYRSMARTLEQELIHTMKAVAARG